MKRTAHYSRALVLLGALLLPLLALEPLEAQSYEGDSLRGGSQAAASRVWVRDFWLLLAQKQRIFAMRVLRLQKKTENLPPGRFPVRVGCWPWVVSGLIYERMASLSSAMTAFSPNSSGKLM